MQTRNLITALLGLLMLVFATPSYGENWVYVTEYKITPEDTDYPIYTRKFYIDVDSKYKLNEDRFTIWQKFQQPDRRWNDGRPFRSDRIYYFLMEYDCNRKTKSLLRYDMIEGMVPSESFDWSGMPNPRVESIAAGSVDEKMLLAACGSGQLPVDDNR